MVALMTARAVAISMKATLILVILCSLMQDWILERMATAQNGIADAASALIEFVSTLSPMAAGRVQRECYSGESVNSWTDGVWILGGQVLEEPSFSNKTHHSWSCSLPFL